MKMHLFYFSLQDRVLGDFLFLPKENKLSVFLSCCLLFSLSSSSASSTSCSILLKICMVSKQSFEFLLVVTTLFFGCYPPVPAPSTPATSHHTAVGWLYYGLLLVCICTNEMEMVILKYGGVFFKTLDLLMLEWMVIRGQLQLQMRTHMSHACGNWRHACHGCTQMQDVPLLTEEMACKCHCECADFHYAEMFFSY